MRRLVRLAVLAVVVGFVGPLAAPLAPSGPLAPASATAAVTNFPGTLRGYHTYAEMVADIEAVAAAHPGIVSLRSIGRSAQGRTLWVAEVSRAQALSQPEPEVLFDGLHHADEHMSLEMTIRILHWLADGYGTDARVTGIVNTRRVWILFAVNPDGAEYDIAGGRLHSWRKSRQPNAGTTAIGTDLNRNYGYRWGCCGLVSRSPASPFFRGSAPFSAPETRAYRDFVASRVVNGRQQIRLAISFHESGRLVMWPYGYTTARVPADMTAQDQAALAAIGRHMAASNGYKPEQASGLYVDSGTSRDWLYGTYRVFAYTIELSTGIYRPAGAIASETGRNRDAVLYAAEMAACPLGVLGAAVRIARCGAFDDDLEVARGWTVNPDGTDTAPANGRWARGVPARTTSGLVVLQPGTATSGRSVFATGLAAGTSANANDLDGRTTIRSAPITLPVGAGQRLTFRYVFAHLANSSAADHLLAIVETSSGSRTVVWGRFGARTVVAGSWGSASISMDAWAGQTIRLRFEAVDGAAASTVEAGLDDIRITQPGP